MKYSELPKEYKKLADKYEVTCIDEQKDRIDYRFIWCGTDEGEDFWSCVDDAISLHDLPRLTHELFEPSDSEEGKDLSTDQYLDTKSSPLNSQVGGDHYTQLKIQPLDVILANDLNFLEGNVIKYVLRYRNKGMENDLRKAIDCLEKLIKHEYE